MASFSRQGDDKVRDMLGYKLMTRKFKEWVAFGKIPILECDIE